MSLTFYERLIDIFVIDPENCSTDKDIRDEMQKEKLVSWCAVFQSSISDDWKLTTGSGRSIENSG
jgi:hypothetical protein